MGNSLRDQLLKAGLVSEQKLKQARTDKRKQSKQAGGRDQANEESRRRTRVIRIFPNDASCLRLVRALTVETHENWIEAIRYINMDLLREHKKEALRKLDEAA